MAHCGAFMPKMADRRLLSGLRLEASQIFFSPVFILFSVTHLTMVHTTC